MKLVLMVLRDAVRYIWADLWTVLVCNLIWSLANLLIIPGPPATLALVYYANRLAHDEVADLKDFWDAFQKYWRPAWRWGAINIFIASCLVGNLILTSRSTYNQWIQFLPGLYLALLVSWLAVQFFALPFMFEQEQLSVLQALRNGASLIGNNLGFSFTLLSLILIILVAGTIFFMFSFAFGAVLVALAANYSVINRLENIKQPG